MVDADQRLLELSRVVVAPGAYLDAEMLSLHRGPGEGHDVLRTDLGHGRGHDGRTELAAGGGDGDAHDGSSGG